MQVHQAIRKGNNMLVSIIEGFKCKGKTLIAVISGLVEHTWNMSWRSGLTNERESHCGWRVLVRQMSAFGFSGGVMKALLVMVFLAHQAVFPR